MSIQNLPLSRAMAAKMIYLEKRQGVISQNIANADTPHYRSQDLTKVDFGSVLKDLTNTKKIPSVHMETTSAGHMPSPNDLKNSKDIKDRLTYEVSPDKNAVILEEQMVRANETQMDYNLITNLMTKTSAIYKIALGRQQ